MKRMKIADLWDYLPSEARYVAMDYSGKWFWYVDKPSFRESDWGNVQKLFARIGIAIDYTGDWKDSLHERPQEIKPGMFGKFWDGEEEPEDDESIYGRLAEIKDSAMPYVTGWDEVYEYFRPCTPPAQVEV